MPVTTEQPRILDLLQGVRQTANGWQARCPGHNDATASLSVALGEDGRTLLHCHAGCPTDVVVQAIGWTLKDLMPSDNGKPQIVTTYDYRDESGELLFQVVRFYPKDFRQRRPVEGGGWCWKLDGVRRVLYRLPELAAADPTATIFVVEGEKDCDRLARLGIIATCNPGGALKWRSEYADHLRRRRVIVIPDNDEPGRRHAEQVAAAVGGVAAFVGILELPGLAKPGGDVADWLDTGRTVEELQQLAEVAPEWEPAEDGDADHAEHPEDGDAGHADHRDRPREPIIYPSLTPAELDCEEYEVEYIIPNILAAGQHGIGGGPHKVLKTLVLACDLGVSVALGGHFLGYFPVTRPARVAIMSGECGFPVLQENLRRVARAAGTELRYVGNMLISDRLPKFGHLDHIDAMGRFLEDNEIEVAILDPAYLALDGGDASNVFIMGTLLRNMADVFVQHRATMILLHHTTKPAGLDGQPIDLTNLSFAGFREFAAQWLLLNRRTPYEPGSGHHELWFSTGGRLGHSGLWGLNIDEGEYHPDAVRRWDVQVLSADEARQATRAAAEAGREKDKDARRDAQLQEAKRKIVEAMLKFPEGETKSLIRDTAGLKTTVFAPAFAELLQDRTVVPCEVHKSSRQSPYPAFKLAER